jgi:hypothetical protein
MELSTGRMGPVSGVTFIYAVNVSHSTLADHRWRPNPIGGPGAQRRYFLALMVDATGSPALIHLRGPPLMFSNVEGGRSWIFVSTLLGGPPSMFSNVVGGRSRILDSGISQGGSLSMFLSNDGGRSWMSSFGTSQGAHHRHFLALMVDALGSPALAPLRGSPLMFLSVDGRRFRIYSSGTSQGAHHRCFLVLMVGVPGSPALAPPRAHR